MHPHSGVAVRARALAVLAALLLVTAGLAALAAPARASTDVRLKLSITWIQQGENPDDDGGDGDYFPEIRIGDGPLLRKPYVQDDVFNPSNFPDPWVFTQDTTVPDDRTTVPILVRLWDYDDGTNFGDDHMDISPGNQDDDLDLKYDIGTDTWTSPEDGITPGQERITGDGDPNFPDTNDGVAITIGIKIERLSPLPDTDGDGIYDVIERFGVRDKDGSMKFDLKAMGANPCRKTVVVQIDFMTGAADGHSHQPKDAAIEEVKRAFEDAPVDPVSPCPYPGFTTTQGVDFVHIAGTSVAESAVMGLDANYRAARDANFSKLLAPYAHYAIFAHQLTAGGFSSGRCCEPNRGNNKDFIVTLGGWRTVCVAPGDNGKLDTTPASTDAKMGEDLLVGSNRTCDTDADPRTDDRQILKKGTGAADADVGTVRDQSGSIMHELGHALGLAHGGADRTNMKPNYLSVMNYAFDPGGIPTGPDPLPRRLDYSRSALPTLDKGQLLEGDGIRDGEDLTRWRLPGGNPLFGPGTGALNWNDDAVPNDPNRVAADINSDDDVCVLAGTDGILTTMPSGNDVREGDAILNGGDACNTAPGPGDTGRATLLTGHDDWGSLKYRAAGSPDAGAPAASPSVTEIGFPAVLGAELALRDFYDPDVTATKTVDKPEALPGDTLTYTVLVRNEGRGTAADVKVTDTFPDGTTAEQRLPDIRAAAERSATFTYVVPCTADNDSVVTNKATVAAKNLAGGDEADTTDNTGTAKSTVKAPRLTLSAATTPEANAGEATTTTLTVRNTGGAAATGVTLTYALPDEVYYSTALDQGSGPRPTEVSGGTLTWRLDPVEAGATATVAFTTRSSLLVTGGTEQTGQAKVVYVNANGCAYDPVTASATSTVTEVAPSRDPRPSGVWMAMPALRTAELLARVQATDTRFDGADGSTPDGLLTQQEASAALAPPLPQPRALRTELLGAYLNLGSRRINAATAVRGVAMDRIGARTVGAAARHARTVLTRPPGGDLAAYQQATLALIEINTGAAERY
ncbi:DUF11 domain-containing protein [Nonomuraea sp. SMC257]|uniref:DUF11 domain-containing protein n=1 Tax=Nonomuraea montanisoli TaxID=2741721 RepID=A0A7Y6M1Z9_9ACTN|nr:CARDB domain-containing protein [Nonomuraea montanisoli]NUW31652.1 DUF11 domain-containing protein [Nonomuraea montanisoli]